MDAPLPKPDEFLALDSVTAELFATLKEWFGVPDAVTLDLSAVDAVVSEMGDPQMVAALAMRKLQALHLLATPGVITSTDVVVSMIQDLQRALVQAPTMRLTRAAEGADWDAALSALAAGIEPGPAPSAADEEDPEVARFRELHAELNAAAAAVLQASEGEIRYLQ